MRVAAFAAALLTAALVTPASADDAPKGWQTWTWNNSCFAVLFPDGPTPGISSEKAYVSVRHMPKEGTFNSISIISGFDEEVGTQATAEIDGQSFDLLVYQGAGFVSSGPREDRLLDSMEKGHEMRVTWRRAESMVVQSYQLSGLDAAKRTIDAGCGQSQNKTASKAN